MANDASVQIRVNRRFAASPERVFDAWLDPATVGRWLFATPGGEMVRVEIEARVGGGFTIVERRGDEEAVHTGCYVEIDRPTRLAFDFNSEPDDPEPSRVTVEVRPAGNDSMLRLVHDIQPKWAEWRDKTEQGWNMILANLAVELGEEVAGGC